MKNITNSIKYIGVDDDDIDLFESQYACKNGVSYNSYLILDDKTVLLDTVDKRKTKEWLNNLIEGLDGRTLDYFIISHMEPDHSGSCLEVLKMFPNVTIVLTDKAYTFLNQFIDYDLSSYKKILVKENDTLKLSNHELVFILAPMVHWPEVMVTYDKNDKVLFSADGFGKFGSLATNDAWEDEARRYYYNIVGKYGLPVQNLLKKASKLDINIIAPLHGPILTSNLGHYLDLYNKWSSYQSEVNGVFIAYASIHGNTKAVALKLEEMAKLKGIDVKTCDLCRDDMSQAISDAFMYDKIILCCATYDGSIFLPMHDFLSHLKYKAFQNKKIALVENGTWAPVANKVMIEMLNQMKNITIIDKMVTIKSSMKNSDFDNLSNLLDELIK